MQEAQAGVDHVSVALAWLPNDTLPSAWMALLLGTATEFASWGVDSKLASGPRSKTQFVVVYIYIYIIHICVSVYAHCLALVRLHVRAACPHLVVGVRNALVVMLVSVWTTPILY